jgi:hypothetical protein
MTTDEINAVAEILIQELEAVKDRPDARIWRRVLVKLALHGVHMQAVADTRSVSPG